MPPAHRRARRKDLSTRSSSCCACSCSCSATDKPPGIAGYKGKGPLRGWVRITATRELIRHLKKQQREHADRALARGGARHVVTTIRCCRSSRREYRTRVRDRAARRDRASSLPRTARCCASRSSNELSIDAIGAAFGVHRATAARWLQRARAALVAATARTASPRGSSSPVDEIDSVIRLVQSRLDASMVRYLRDS